MSAPITPTEADLTTKLTTLRSKNPALGISKLHALLLYENPDWTVSEKRTRKVLQNLGLTLISTPSNAKPGSKKYPSSKVIDNLNVAQWTPNVAVRFFDTLKGKGLVAKAAISEGDTVWKEDPFAIAPEWEIYDLIQRSAACAFCTTPLSDSTLVIRCPTSETANTGGIRCSALYCNRLCQSRAQKHNHPLLCPSRNPLCVPLVDFAKSNQWQGFYALVQCTARILLATHDVDRFEDDWRIFSSFAALGMEERGVWMGTREPLHSVWKKAFGLYTRAFWEPPTEATKKKLDKILSAPLKEGIKKRLGDELFTYEGFLRNLGRMSLNLEGHGGLYTLHSHINHSCDPNVSVRHLQQNNNLSRIFIVAKRDIEPGEELFASYVDPSLPLFSRREKLKEWSFGKCECARCIKEEQEMPEGTLADAAQVFEMGDLERELKAGLGVF